MKGMKQWVSLAILLGVAGVIVQPMLRREPEPAWTPPPIVRFEGRGHAARLIPMNSEAYVEAEDLQGALPLKDGDFMLTPGLFVRYRSSDGVRFSLATFGWGTRIGKSIVAVWLGEDEGQSWLDRATDEQLAGLRTLVLPEEIDPGLMAILERVAALNPNIDLHVPSQEALREALVYFQPRAVFIDDEFEADYRVLAHQPLIDTLMIKADEPGSLDVLPTLPRLRHLMLGEWDPAEAGPIPALAALNSLTVFDTAFQDLSALAPVAGQLEALDLFDFGKDEKLASLAGLEKFGRLQVLGLQGDIEGSPVDYLQPLERLDGLRWVSLPKGLSQQQLERFVSAHPGISFLQLSSKEDAEIDLAPLTGFQQLYGLTLLGEFKNLDVLKSLQSLRYLAIHDEQWEESEEQVEAIIKALPDAVVVRTGSPCLGSGWVLLLVPALAFAWMRRRPPVSAAAA